MKVRNDVRKSTTPLVRPMHCTCHLTSNAAGFQDYYICEEEGHFKTNIWQFAVQSDSFCLCKTKSCLCWNAQFNERTNILVAIRPACMTKGYVSTSFGSLLCFHRLNLCKSTCIFTLVSVILLLRQKITIIHKCIYSFGRGYSFD